MFRRYRLCLVAAAYLAAGVPASAAEIVFSNLDAGAYSGSPAWTISGSPWPDIDQGSAFTPTRDYYLDSISAALADQGVSLDNRYDLWLMSDSGGVPGLIIEQWSFTGLPRCTSAADSGLVAATSTMRPLLRAGAQYWVIASSPAGLGCFYGNSTGDVGLARRLDGAPWDFLSSETAAAFQVEGTPVAEPVTLLLLGTGLVGASLVRRRRR